jgi:hypothetical protein
MTETREQALLEEAQALVASLPEQQRAQFAEFLAWPSAHNGELSGYAFVLPLAYVSFLEHQRVGILADAMNTVLNSFEDARQSLPSLQ